MNGDVAHKQGEEVHYGNFAFEPSYGSDVYVNVASGSYYAGAEGYPATNYNGYIDEVRFWNRALTDAEVAFYDGYKWEGDLAAIVPGMGYYYKSNNSEPVTFYYPTIDATNYQAPAMVMRAPGELPFTPVDHHQFSDNMNVVA